MRRKLFFYVLLLFILLFVALELTNNNDYAQNLISPVAKNYEAKVISVEEDEEKIDLVVKLQTGEKVLLRQYDKYGISQDNIGDTISFQASLELPTGQRNPRCFDYSLHLKSIGIKYVATIEKIQILYHSSSPYDKYCRFLLTKKEAFLSSIDNETARNFVEGIVFGNTKNLDESIYDEFKQNGTAHILAVSGLHIGIIYEIINKILGKKQTSINAITTIILLWSLGILAGWTPSVIRAIGMILIKNYALYMDKRYDSLTSMSLIIILMMIDNPYIVFNTSFHMSYLAVLSIIFITPHFPRKIPDYLAIILAVNIGLLPYQMYQFNTFSATSFLANIPVVYLAGIMLPITFIQFLIFFITGINIGIVTEAMSTFIIFINKIFTLDLDVIHVASPPLWIMILFYGLGYFMLSETFCILLMRKKHKIVVAAILVAFSVSLFANILFSSNFDNADVVFLDVGQGDCVHIKAEGKNILIDGGGSVNYQVGKKTVMPYLLKNGIKKVDLGMATHMHTDHFEGLRELEEERMLEDIKVGLVAGKTFKINDNILIKTLWPIKTPKEDINQDENKNCSVFMIYYNGTKILITGDLDQEGERQMLKYYQNSDILKADILKIGHHGSQYSTSMEFLEEVEPIYCVIQVGKNNYGHPHVKTIEKCQEKCIMVLRNDVHGAVGFSFIKDNIDYCTMISTDGKRNGI